MATCLVCVSAKYFLKLGCGCEQYCQSCILDWFREQIKIQNISEEFVILCPTADARHEIAFHEILEVAKGSEYEAEIEQATLKILLRGMREMNFCPREECEYAGWVDLKGTCSDPVECEKCGEKWKIIDLLPKWSRRFRVVKGIFTGEDDTLSILWKDIWTKSCPGCGVNIEKFGGCSNMHCNRCEIYFCWICMKPDRFHNTDICSQRIIMWALIYAILILFLTLKLAALAHITVPLFAELCLVVTMILSSVAGVFLLAYAFFEPLQYSFYTRFLCFIVYVLAYVILVHYTVTGERIWDLQLALIVALLHCSVGLIFLQQLL